MSDGQIAAIATMVVAGFGALAAIGTKLIEKYRPTQERRTAIEAIETERRMSDIKAHTANIANLQSQLNVVLGMMDVRDKHAAAQDAAIARHQAEIERLQTGHNRLSSKVYKLMGAIDRSQVRFPETREFWQHEFTQIGD